MGKWDIFTEKMQRVPSASVDQAGPLPVILEPGYNVLRWENFLKNPEIPTLAEVRAPPTRLQKTAAWARWLALGLALLLLGTALWWLLRWLGHQDARLLNGGFDRWQQRGLATEAGPVQVPAEEFRPEPQAHLVLHSDEIVNAGDERGSLQLVDARDTDRFAGISEPIDRVAVLSLPAMSK